MPRFLMTSIASILLAACGVDTMEVIPSETEEAVGLIESESEETQNTDTKKIAATEEKDIEETSSVVDESRVAVIGAKEVEAAVGVSELQEQNQERALNRLLLETHLEREGYSYYFSETDSQDFVQIEVREIAEDDVEHASLEGAYRYIIKTEEILMRDYLTGDFIPYEEIE